MHSIKNSFKQYYADKKLKLKNFFQILSITYIIITLFQIINQNTHNPKDIIFYLLSCIMINMLIILVIFCLHYITHRCIHTIHYIQLKKQVSKYGIYSICDKYCQKHSVSNLTIYFTNDIIKKTMKSSLNNIC